MRFQLHDAGQSAQCGDWHHARFFGPGRQQCHYAAAPDSRGQYAMKMPSRMQHAMLARPRSRGVSLIPAVFLVVVLAGLTAAIVRVTMVQQATASMDMLSVQAYQAARSG